MGRIKLFEDFDKNEISEKFIPSPKTIEFKKYFAQHYAHITPQIDDRGIEQYLAQKHIKDLPIEKQADLFSDFMLASGGAEVQENYQDGEDNFIVKWTDKEGYSYSVTADSFVNSEALVRALKQSSGVKLVSSKKLGLG